jgi:hypothetical protein
LSVDRRSRNKGEKKLAAKSALAEQVRDVVANRRTISQRGDR